MRQAPSLLCYAIVDVDTIEIEEEMCEDSISTLATGGLQNSTLLANPLVQGTAIKETGWASSSLQPRSGENGPRLGQKEEQNWKSMLMQVVLIPM